MIVFIITATILLFSGAYIMYRPENKLSIKSSIDKAGLPVISVKIKDYIFNFLLDTGSTESHITKELSNLIDGELKECNYSFISSNGDSEASKIKVLPITVGKKTINHEFVVNSNLDYSFASVLHTNGVVINGIFGNDFMTKCKFKIDLKKHTVKYV